MKFPVTGFENLHRHCDSSILDGLATVREYAEYSKEVNQQYLAITDHGVMGAVPTQIDQAEKHNLSPIFGAELYCNPLQPKVQTRSESASFRKDLSDDQKKIFDKSYHLLALAKNDVGYKNLVNLTSWAWLHGFYKKPRINHEQLVKHREGIVFTSACGNSEIARAYLDHRDDDQGFAMVEKYLEMVCPGDLYLEMMLLDWKEQKPLNEFLIRAADRYNLPLILSCDCHVCRKADSEYQMLMLLQQNRKTIGQIQAMEAAGVEDIFEMQDKNLWMKSEEELNQKWEQSYADSIPFEVFQQAKENTVNLAAKCGGVELDRSIKLPHKENADKLFKDAVFAGMDKKGLPKNQVYLKRIMEEIKLIQKKGFASYFLIQQQFVEEARRVAPEVMGWEHVSAPVGPGRGCLVGDTLVYVREGGVLSTKRLFEIECGDFVLSSDGMFHRVVRAMKYPLSPEEQLVRIKSGSSSITCTLEHLILIDDPAYSDAWIDAKSLTKKHTLTFPITKRLLRQIHGHQVESQLPYCLSRVGIDDVLLIHTSEEFVYDIEVEDVHDYCTIAGIVHNSVCGSLAAYCLDLHDIDPIRHDLLFSRFLSPSRGGKQIKLRFPEKTKLVE